jgi:DNA-binding SARP family transcriptional activator
MSMKFLEILGPVYLRDGAQSTLLTAERPHQVLLYLACQNRWADRAELAELFWPLHSPEAGRRNVRKALHNIRRLGLNDELLAKGNLVRLDMRTDLGNFGRALVDGNFAQAVKWVRGRLGEHMTDGKIMRFDNWLDAERSRVQSMWRQAAHLALPVVSDLEAIDLARALLADDGFDEIALRALVRHLVRLGDRSEARRVIAASVQRFRDELETTLSSTTQALIDELGLRAEVKR